MTEAGLLAGFDAGQTHTTCRLVDASSGETWAEGQGPGVSHLASPRGPEHFWAALQASLEAAYGHRHGHGQQKPALLAAAIGASGIEVGSPGAESELQLQGKTLAAGALGLQMGRICVTGDERTALRGAMGQARAGILVISGTGTIAVGRNGAGLEHRCSGWGWLLDGAGSAMDIGRDGLALSLQMADARVADGPLRQQIWQHLGLDPQAPSSPQAIKTMVVAPGFGAAGFARLAPVVAELAQAGDSHALAIFKRSGQALAQMTATISGRLDLEAPLVWAAGGALLHLAPLSSAFSEALAIACPGAQLAAAAGDACDGALGLARELLNAR
ncbi:N-acetylglucosamine kinase [Cyanobium sp. HWJ4-Hawea]|uniref:BadF/BadG/BcrA/BcrD ATPase family protein n=1 Tax=Cyanobium sp. HWJ4-Hawea TaxID=2823713 RepID=UPI0020CF95A2|nr:BadF/BadG/BcrA/BcrD ATPase family protein [Cyanobium sp. HWJ4-Hawea]MCP9808928.1 N-acetylglucosamine kinase [Cyanobium sp. HWJ4-Hawea]